MQYANMHRLHHYVLGPGIKLRMNVSAILSLYFLMVCNILHFHTSKEAVVQIHEKEFKWLSLHSQKRHELKALALSKIGYIMI